MRRKAVFIAVLVGCVLIAMTRNFLGQVDKVQRKIEGVRFQTEAISMWLALSNYAHVYGNISSSNNATVFSAITGQNSDRIIFLSVKTNQINSFGEYTDYWQTPYQLQVATDVSFNLRSAGRNRLFGDEDDLLFERSWK